MEKDLLQYYINAVDKILEEKDSLSKSEYEYVYRLVYSKYKGLGNIARALKKSIEAKISKHTNVEELFNTNIFSESEKQIIINYWVSSAFANAANKKKISKETLFVKIVDRDYNKLSAVLASKQYTDEHGVVYNGSEIFRQVKDSADAQDVLNEFAWATVGKIALSAAVWLGLDALSPTVAKQVPGICSLVRNCAEKYPVATKIANYTISPFDLDAFIEQDKINKGEKVEGEDEIQDDDENFDDYDVVMDDGSIYNDYEDEVILDSSSDKVGKIYRGSFTDEDGEVLNYTFEDKDA
jgi:virulence-associated protein VapD